MQTKNLSQRIEAHRITYPATEHGFTIEGNAFVCEFHDPVDHREFCDTVSDPSEPWLTFGIQSAIGEGYRKLLLNLIILDDGKVVGAPGLSLEVCDEWFRVYVKGDTPADRVAEFLRTVDDEFGIEARFPE